MEGEGARGEFNSIPTGVHRIYYSSWRICRLTVPRRRRPIWSRNDDDGHFSPLASPRWFLQHLSAIIEPVVVRNVDKNRHFNCRSLSLIVSLLDSIKSLPLVPICSEPSAEDILTSGTHDTGQVSKLQMVPSYIG